MNPIPFSIARAGARSGPSVSAALWRLAGSDGRSYGSRSYAARPLRRRRRARSTSASGKRSRSSPRTPPRLRDSPRRPRTGPEPESVAPSAPSGGRRERGRGAGRGRPGRARGAGRRERGREQLGRAGRERGAEQGGAADDDVGVACGDRAREGSCGPRRWRSVSSGTTAIGTAGRSSAIRAIRPPRSGRRRLPAPRRGCPRWPSSLSPTVEQLLGIGLAARASVRRHEAECDHGGARAEPALTRDPRREVERPALRRSHARERANAEMAEVGAARRALDDLELVPEVEAPRRRSRSPGPRFAVEAGARTRMLMRPASAIASGSGSTSTGSGASRSTASGSLSPWPVITQTTRVARLELGPRARAASPAAEAGSQKTPSSRARSRQASRTSSSVTVTTAPPERSIAARRRAVRRLGDPDRAGEGQRAGRPPGRREAAASRRPTPRSPARRRTCSRRRRRGARARRARAPSSSAISKAAVFWPSSRYGFSELTSTCVPRSASSRAAVERLVEAAADLEHARAERARLRQLPGRDGARGLEDRGAEARPGRVGGGGGGRVPGRRADDRLGALLERLRDRHRHAAILEGAGRVRALALEPELEPEPLGEPLGADERRRALAERHERRRVGDRQAVAVAIDRGRPPERPNERPLRSRSRASRDGDGFDFYELARCSRGTRRRGGCSAAPPNGEARTTSHTAWRSSRRSATT